jgi:hypothetical protein
LASSPRSLSTGPGSQPQAEPCEGDEAARDELARLAGGYIPTDVDAWLARALAAHRGHYTDPAARKAAAASCRSPSSHTPRCCPRSLA